MVLSTDLKSKIKKLLEEKKYKEAVSFIEKNIDPIDRSAGILNILGVSKLSEKVRTKEILISSVDDFRKAFQKDKSTKLGLEIFANFIHTSVELSDVDNSLVNFDELINLYNNSQNLYLDDYEINNAMKRVYTRLNNPNKVLFHLNQMLQSNNYSTSDLCFYVYNKMFLNDWSQKDFFQYTSLMDSKLIEYSKDKIDDFPNNKNEKIKIAFLSADIRHSHSITYFLRSVLQSYDKKKYQIYLILNQRISDQTTSQFQNYVDDVFNIIDLDDIGAINKIRKLDLDFVFDLMGMTSRNRLNLFKNRIARKQVLWLGYCNTTGIKNMDYIFTDENLIYPNEASLYSEKIIYLSKIWNCHAGLNFKRKKINPPVLKKNFITFGCFNNYNKITDQVINVWSKILNLVKNSKLVLKSSMNIHSTKRLTEKFKYNGVLDSIIFKETEKEFNNHLELYEQVDIALDTFPYNGVTTSFEAIFMGVPVLTMSGYNFNSRCGSSINKNLNLNDLISKNEEDYISKAVNLSKDKNLLFKYRELVFNNCMDSSLFDVKNFSKEFYKKINQLYSQ